MRHFALARSCARWAALAALHSPHRHPCRQPPVGAFALRVQSALGAGQLLQPVGGFDAVLPEVTHLTRSAVVVPAQ